MGLLPPLLAGMVAAVALEVSVALLLFADEGLLPALTLILTIEIGALGLGLWSGPLSLAGGVVEEVRRRWLFSLIAFALAAALSAGLSFMGDLPRNGLGQGLGLGFLGALPLFSIGSLLGAMGRPDEGGRPLLPLVGAPAALGGAVGLLLAGNVLLPHATPYTLFLSCVVVLSGGALLQGWVLDGRASVEVLETVAASTGELRVEGRAVGNPRRELKVLLEGGRLRGAEDPEGNPGRAWEAAVLDGLGGVEREAGSILYLGGGSGTLVRLLAQRSPQSRIHVVERSGELVQLARSRFATWDGWESLGLQIGEPLTTLVEPQGSFQLIVVDCGALPTLAGVPALRDADWVFLAHTLDSGGVLALGGLPPHGVRGTVSPEQVMREGLRWFEGASLYQGESSTPGAPLLREVGDAAESLLLFFKAGAAPWPLSLSGFQLQPAEEG